FGWWGALGLWAWGSVHSGTPGCHWSSCARHCNPLWLLLHSCWVTPHLGLSSVLSGIVARLPLHWSFLVSFVLRCVTTAVEVIHVTGYLGSMVKVFCSYDEGYESYEKYLCKNDCGSYDALITSDTKSNGRFTLDDDKVSGTFTVNINNLTQNDSGSYLCGVHRNSKLDIFTYVELEVQGERS
uniref:Immunoglobulin domain-containing protein n=1 Tax=Haplochromis burtoni TaxID=8153 RepID=A0A3Q2VGI0_HAPBU